MKRFRLTLTGVGAMNSPRFAPAGLLVEHDDSRVMLDGGSGSEPPGGLEAWLVTDERAELMAEIRALASDRKVIPRAGPHDAGGLSIRPRPVVHTSHPTCGYLIEADNRRIVWAPEFFEFPPWARAVNLMFADAAGWNRPIRFSGGVGGHAAALDVARAARKRGVRRLIFAHIGRPTIKAIDAGARPSFGEFGHDGAVYYPRRWRT